MVYEDLLWVKKKEKKPKKNEKNKIKGKYKKCNSYIMARNDKITCILSASKRRLFNELVFGRTNYAYYSSEKQGIQMDRV